MAGRESGRCSGDPFTGAWRFNAQRSELSTPAPRSWSQQISVTETEIEVREKIAGADGSERTVTVRARFDGKDYPVSGSPAIDSIAYERTAANSISGTGRKNGAVALTETVAVDPEQGFLRMRYSLWREAKEAASGVAVFERDGSGKLT